MTALYHREIYLPEIIRNLGARTIRPRVTRHAMEAAAGDRYGAMQIPTEIKFSGADVVEAEFTDKKLSKLVVRVKYDATRDAVFAIGFDRGESFIKTAWFNLATDKHATLKRHLYAKR
jgi:hypothetical protein